MTRPTWDQLREWPARARTTDPITSHIAAAAIDTGPHRARILAALATFESPANRDMLAAKTHLTPYQCSKRIPELVEEHLIEVVHEWRGGVFGPKTLVGFEGFPQQCYSITALGRAALR